MGSTVLFILGVFLLFLTWIKGEAFWAGMQSALWGLFGVSSVLLSPIVIYVAVMMALDRSKSAVIVKVLQGALLILLVGPMFEIFYSMSKEGDSFSGDGFSGIITRLYENGSIEHQGGGALSIFLGGSLVKLCGEVCALIIIILLIILFVMLLTNITFIDIFRFIVSAFRKLAGSISESSEESARRREESKKAREEKAPSVPEPKEKQGGFVDLSKYLSDKDKKEDSEEKKPKKQKKESETLPAPIEEPPVQPEEAANKSIDPVSELRSATAEAASEDEGHAQTEDAPDKGEAVNPIYVGKDGQTTLIEMENSSENGYVIPPIELLNPSQSGLGKEDTSIETEKNAELLVETIKSFGVVTRIVGIHKGPSVTRYELQPAAGVKVSRITSLADDIALNLAANGVRIEAPIPGKAAVGIELANKVRETVCIRELIDSDEFRQAGGKLCFPVGKDIEGKIVIGDISKMPHVLIAGTTGSGKSVFTNSVIMSILYNASSDEVRLILIDPKQVEFPVYNGIPHLLIPVVTEAKKAAGALGWAVTEMLKRYKLFADNGVRDLKDYNKLAKSEDLKCLPQIVIVVDELADLMMAARKEVEDSICRLAQLARAAGMHLIVATQSPRVDIVTGLIKANIPSRVALKVSNQMDSRVILDEGGAEKLLGNGDLLYMPVGLGKPVRVQGSYVATDEIKRVVDYLKTQTSSQYDDEVASEVERHIPVPKGEKTSSEQGQDPSQDNMTEAAIEAVVEAGQASTSYLQRRLKLGYARAARIMDELEELGIVGPADGAKPREVRLTRAQWLERKAMLGNESEGL